MNNKLIYVPIGEFGRIITGKTPKTDVSEFWNGDVPFITPTDIPSFDSKYLLTTERTISSFGVRSHKNVLLPENSLCVSCIATIGKLCLTRVPSITNQQINSIIINEKYDPNYLLFVFRYYLPYLQLIGGGTGSGTPIINKNKFSKLKYPVFDSLDIQKSVATVLDNYEQMIENNSRRISILEEMIEIIYKEWFVRFKYPGYENVQIVNGIPQGWYVTKIREKFITSSGGTPSRSNPSFYDGNIPWVKTGELQDSYIFDTKEHISEEAVKKSSAKMIPSGSLLIAMYAGSNVGNLGFVMTPCTCNQACCVFNCKSDVSLNYLFYFLKSERNYLQSISFGAAQQNISQDLIKKTKILVPDIELMKRFDSFCEPISNEIKTLILQNYNLIKQRDSLFPRLMSGKLSVEGKEIV